MTKEEILNLIKPIVICKITKVEAHPNADRLQVLEVDLGSQTRRVITGAPNVEVGQHVPFLDQGNIIPGYRILNGEEIMLQVKNLRGLDSDCMILSKREIGLSDDHEGIYVIEEEKMKDLPLGSSILEILSEEDTQKIVDNQKQN